MNISNLTILFLNMSILKFIFFTFLFALNTKKMSLSAMTHKSIAYVITVFQNTPNGIPYVNNYKAILNGQTKKNWKYAITKYYVLFIKKQNKNYKC